MKTNKELLERFENQNNSVRDYWLFYSDLTPEERSIAFDLAAQRNPMEVSA